MYADGSALYNDGGVGEEQAAADHIGEVQIQHDLATD